jgi:pyrroline-5-carboxylate reductase
MTHKSVGFIGGGRVTRILMGGLERAGQLRARVVVSDGNAETLSKLKGDVQKVEGVIREMENG